MSHSTTIQNPELTYATSEGQHASEPIATYASALSQAGFWVALPAMLALPRGNMAFNAIAGAVCAGGASAIGAAIGTFIDALNQSEPPHRADKKSWLAAVSAIVGAIAVVGWILPVVGVPTSIIGYVLGRRATGSASRNVGLAGMGLSLAGLFLATLNAYLGVVLAE